ncbi:Retrotransposon gag domain-containing 1 [Gossypium arboreum]|uniref:Retrotransposon gag domain-containing 1 n=1 Tax=Gossypium arboreum TaxID=29729 RepID=A0A0B0MJZ4_GOSAR|nr:Retrotransposon gag domain-containing 1 [Gossypium arboreum]
MASATADDVESNESAPAEGTALVDSELVTMSQGGGAREAYLHMMDAWYSEFIQENPNTPPPPPPSIPQYASVALQRVDVFRRKRPPIDKRQKQGVEEFCPKVDDDLVRAEFCVTPTRLALPMVEYSCVYCTEREDNMGILPGRVSKEVYQSKGRKTVTEYESEFVRLSKYARECVSIDAIMCKRFEEGLNEDI